MQNYIIFQSGQHFLSETLSRQFRQTGLLRRVYCNVILLEASHVNLRRPFKPAPATTMYILLYLAVKGSEFRMIPTAQGARGGVVVKSVRYKPAGRGFDS
jgi:hypothetical protein